MTDGDALRQAVFDAPWDDATRLVYADWLEEHGDADQLAHAEFIRVQTRLEQKPTAALRIEEDRLLAFHGKRWLSPVPEPLRKDVCFVGGFIRRLSMRIGSLILHGEELVRHCPIDQIEMGRWLDEEGASTLANLPWLGRIRWLLIPDGWVTKSAAVRTLLDSPHLLNLRYLRLDHFSLTERKIGFLCNWPRLSGLETLALPRSSLDLSAYRRLARCRLTGLRRLELSGPDLSVDVAKLLRDTECFATLPALEIAGIVLETRAKQVLIDHFGPRVVFT